MSKFLLQTIGANQQLYRDTMTGLAWIEDRSSGASYALHPCTASIASIRDLKKNGDWGLTDQCVRSRGFHYNIDRYIPCHDPAINAALLSACHCGGKHVNV